MIICNLQIEARVYCERFLDSMNKGNWCSAFPVAALWERWGETHLYVTRGQEGQCVHVCVFVWLYFVFCACILCVHSYVFSQ